MKKTTLFLLLFCLGFACQATAQHKTVVYGDLGVSSVNISIVDTQHGTSTDAEGHYELSLSDCSKTVNLYYSCIGYQDTIVSLSTKELQHDSINISFKMRKHNYNLQEVSVTAKQKLYGERYFFMDFDVFDSTICILAACPNKNLRCIILADEALRGHDTIPLPAHIKPEQVLRDCMGNCQLVATDSVYEIGLTSEPHYVIATEKNFYFKTMSSCLFATDEHVFFKEKGMQGYLTSFYRVDRETKKPQHLFMSNMTDNISKHGMDMAFHIKWVIEYPEHHVAPFGIWSQHLRKNWYRPSDGELLLADNSLYYFDQSLGYIQHYDLDMNKIDSCTIQYPFMEGWHRILYQDLAQNRFFTIVKDQLFEIDLISGNISPKTTLDPNYYSKISIHNGQLFMLKRTLSPSGTTKTFIERRKL